MNLKVTREWLLRMAEREGDGIFSVGGLVGRIDRGALTASASPREGRGQANPTAAPDPVSSGTDCP
jgi:hypothetical protein